MREPVELGQGRRGAGKGRGPEGRRAAGFGGPNQNKNAGYQSGPGKFWSSNQRTTERGWEGTEKTREARSDSVSGAIENVN